MELHFEPMKEAFATAIAGWRYEGIYSFYDADQDAEDLAELLSPACWPGRYFAVTDGGTLIGFFCFERSGRVAEIGLGMRPDLTGLGLGTAFVKAGMEFARQNYHPEQLRLIVATFNQRAIKVYETLGFKHERLFMNETNGGTYEFLSMVMAA